MASHGTGKLLCPLTATLYSVRRSGLTPIVATVILVVLVIAMAAGTITFVQTQQAAVTQELTTALDGDLRVGAFSCQGHEIAVHFSNQGDRPISSTTAEIRVLQGGDINYTLSPLTTPVSGDFLLIDGQGYFNVSTDAPFHSGELYRIQIDFGDGQTIDRLCRAGADWWDLDWGYRKLIPVEKTVSDPSGVITVNRTVYFPESMLRTVGEQDCSSVRIVEDGAVTPYDVAYCPDLTDGTTENVEVDFITTINGTDQQYDTYLYYGALDVQHPSFSEAIGGPVAPVTVTPPVEQR